MSAPTGWTDKITWDVVFRLLAVDEGDDFLRSMVILMLLMWKLDDDAAAAAAGSRVG